MSTASRTESEMSTHTFVKEEDYGDFMVGDSWVRTKVSQAKAPPDTIKLASREIIPISGNTGNFFVEALAAEVRQAKEVVCLSSYMIQQGSLTKAVLEAATRGVRVYILTAGEEELARSDSDLDEAERGKVAEYRQLLNSLAGKALVRTAPHFHAKFLLVDPRSADRRGMMMTCNATVDAMSGKNLEVAVRLSKPETSSFYSQFIRAFWKEAKHELLKPNALSDIHGPPSGLNFGDVNHPATFLGCVTLKEKIQELVDSAERTLVISGWSFSSSHPVLLSLSNAIERGVSVEILTRPSYGNTEALASLVSRGANVKGQERFHAKMIVADSRRSIVMTSNFTERGLDTGFEAGIVLDQEETKALSSVVEYWKSLCDWELHHDLRLRDASAVLQKKAASERKLQLIEVADSIDRDLGVHSPASLDEPEYVPQIDSANPNSILSTKLFRKVRYSWRVIQPTVPTKAKMVDAADIPFPLYKMPNGELLIAVSKPDDVTSAKPYAQSRRAKIVFGAK